MDSNNGEGESTSIFHGVALVACYISDPFWAIHYLYGYHEFSWSSWDWICFRLLLSYIERWHGVDCLAF